MEYEAYCEDCEKTLGTFNTKAEAEATCDEHDDDEHDNEGTCQVKEKS